MPSKTEKKSSSKPLKDPKEETRSCPFNRKLIVPLILLALFFTISLACAGIVYFYSSLNSGDESRTDTDKEQSSDEDSKSSEADEETGDDRSDSEEESQGSDSEGSIFEYRTSDEDGTSGEFIVKPEDGKEYVLDFVDLFGRRILIGEVELISADDDIYFYFDIFPAGCPTPADEACEKFMTVIHEAYYDVGGIWRLDMESGQFEHIFTLENYQSDDTSAPRITEKGSGNEYQIEVSYYIYNDDDYSRVTDFYILDTDKGTVEREKSGK
ncbi:hypothetical protein JW710_01685 [Candidatus Dojkabacteria bacterium]|nr:hypothetical protein [Candidatus Dojkabacteria bacterium]